MTSASAARSAAADRGEYPGVVCARSGSASTSVMESARCLFILLQIPAFWAECREGAVLFVQLFERGGDGVTKSSFTLHSRSDTAGE